MPNDSDPSFWLGVIIVASLVALMFLLVREWLS